VAFGEINIIDREQWGRMSPSQTRALLELGRFRQSLKADPVKSSESQILEGFLASTIAIDASNAVRGRIAEVKARILDQMKKQEELTQAIVTTRQSIDQTLTRLTDIREIGELAMVRVAWNEVRRLQEQPGEVSRWVIIDKSDKQNPRLSINEEARSLLQQAISKLEDEIGKLPPESERNPAQKEQYRKMQERLERGRIQMAFVKEVDANIRNMNESYNIGSEKRTLQGYVGFFRESGLPYMSGDYGRITDQTTSDELDKRINYIYGNDREQVGGLHKAYEQAVNDLGKDGLSEEERRRIAQNLETIVRNLSTCISHTESVRRQVNFSNVISYAAKRFIKEDLWQELIRLKLTQQKPDRF
jgi:membrane-associated HD superfamily phosphohydrolase